MAHFIEINNATIDADSIDCMQLNQTKITILTKRDKYITIDCIDPFVAKRMYEAAQVLLETVKPSVTE